MDILNIFQELVTTMINQLGLFIQVPGFVLGAVLVLWAWVQYRKIQKSPLNGRSWLGTRIVSGVSITLGVPILLTSIRVGATDSLLWGLIALAVSLFWLAAERSKLVKLIGIVAGIIAIGAIIGIAKTYPEGSVIADKVMLMVNQAVLIWTAYKSN